MDLATIKVEWDDVIIARLDYDTMPKQVREQYAKDALEGLRSIFPNNKILILSKGLTLSSEKKYPISLFKDEPVEIPEPPAPPKRPAVQISRV